EAGNGRLPRAEDAARVEPDPGAELVAGIGQPNTRMPPAGKVPPWKQPAKPVDPDAPRPFGWIAEIPLGAAAGAALPDRTSMPSLSAGLGGPQGGPEATPDR